MIIITKEELSKLKRLQNRNKGNYGTCFLYDDDKILKGYTNTFSFSLNGNEIKRNIENSVGVKVDGVSFPIDIANTKGFVFSYIMPFIEGTLFNDLLAKALYTDFDISFDNCSHLYDDAISKAYEIASFGIQMNDFHKNNYKIKEDFSIGIFDVDFYESKALINGFTERYLRHYNMLEINEAFYEMLKRIYTKKMTFCNSKEKLVELRKLDEIINNFPRNKKNYVDDVLTKVNDEFKTDSVKKLIMRDL